MQVHHNEITVAVKFRWWVYPYLQLARFNLLIGIPVNIDKIADTIARRGLKINVAKGFS